MLDTDFILFDRNKYFVNKLKDYKDILVQPLLDILTEFCAILEISSEEAVINYLFFTLVTYWENLIKDYVNRNLEVSLIVFSDQHFLQSKMIKHLLEFELPQDCSIEIYKETKLSVKILNELSNDIIISNFEMPASVEKEVIVIQDFPTISDIKNIKEAIRAIRLEKNLLLG